MKGIVASLFAGVGLASCSMVVSERAIGDRPVDAGRFTGTWNVVDGEASTLRIRGRDAAHGLLTVEIDGEDVEFELRDYNGWQFANRVIPDAGATGFAWHRVELAADGRSFRVWRPDPDVFESLIDAGKLNGRIVVPPGNSSPTVVITEKDGKWVDRLMAGEFGRAFTPDSPAVHVRVDALPDGAGR